MNKNNRKEKKDNLNILKFIGPGLLVTVGFIDPGNWASNFAAGSEFGYAFFRSFFYIPRTSSSATLS